MEEPLVASYDRLEQAYAARDALVAAGFAPATIHVASRQDEAGPVQGNFTVGDGRPDTTGDPYDHNYADVEQRGTVMLTVEVADAAAREGAATVLGVAR